MTLSPEPAPAERQPVGGGACARLPVPGPRHAGGGAQAGAARARGGVRPLPQGDHSTLELATNLCEAFTITEKAPIKAFSVIVKYS